MNRFKIFSCLLGTALFLSLACLPVSAADNANINASLVGLKSIYVKIQPIDSNLGLISKMERRLKKDTEMQLRRAGIELLTEKDYERLMRSPRYPLARLYIAVTIRETGYSHMKLYSLAVQARQVTFLARKPVVKLLMPTWEKRKVGFDDNPDVVYAHIKNMVDRFINDYRTANPR